MTSYDVVVVIPCHNAAATLDLQLEALARQESTPPFEVVVVDNRSTDRLADCLERWLGRTPGLRSVDANAAAGAGYARNVGVAASDAAMLLFCDADDVVGPDWVAAGAAALGKTEVACGADVTLPSSAFVDVDRIWAGHLVALPGGPVQPRREPAPYPIVLGGNLAIRRSAYAAVGGYDPTMVTGNEDNDLAIRLERNDFLIARAPGMRLAIRARGDLRSVYRRARVAGRGHQQLVARHQLQATSPHLRGQAWRADLPRTALAAARMLGRPAARRDWAVIATRLGVAQGLWEGEFLVRTGRFPAGGPTSRPLHEGEHR
ncbi:glycosyltransferase family 2 protein [Calidifontibacter terrae]